MMSWIGARRAGRWRCICVLGSAHLAAWQLAGRPKSYLNKMREIEI